VSDIGLTDIDWMARLKRNYLFHKYEGAVQTGHAMSYPRSSVLVSEELPWWRLAPGLVLIGSVAFAAIETAKVAWFQAHGIGVLTLAIALGMAAGNSVYPRIAAASACGVIFSKQTLLRAGIVLYGLKLTFQDIAKVGVPGVAIDALLLLSTFALSCWAGTRLFKLDGRSAMLIGAGSAICGAAAVMAAGPVIGGRSEQVTTAVSTVVLFGTLAMLSYPLMFEFNAHHHLLAWSPTQYGIYAGSTIHEVAQVVVAGRAVSESAANTAVITKMVRVMLLAPFLIALSAYSSRHSKSLRGEGRAPEAKSRIVIPWFALGFIAIAALNSLNLLPNSVVSTALTLDTVVLAMAMAALGMTTHVAAIRAAGVRPLALGALLFVWLAGGGFAINAALLKLLAPGA
jgi:uncharacterized integral membrane protein (TIGR00698 family)